MEIDEIRRKAFNGYLQAARLPLTAAERALGKKGKPWAPAMVYDRAESMVREAAATVFRDDTLKADAKLQQRSLDELGRAAQAEAEAARIREQAEADARAVTERDRQRKQQVTEKVVAKKTQARKVTAAQEEALDRRETTAKRDLLDKESKALRNQRAAAEAKAEVLELDDELERTKAARKSS